MKSPAGAWQWTPTDPAAQGTSTGRSRSCKIASTDDVYHRPRAEDGSVYNKIARRFHENPEEFRLAFSKAWYKLTHRDMGPVSRLLGPKFPKLRSGRTRFRLLTTNWLTLVMLST